ncbi:MAG: threonine--tRNA ligase, partial [Rickettsiales bacterium]|nr:threonine--tRNA ligase [Rickettsiales bacterium]
YAGHFPLWLAPLQVVAAPITNQFDDYINEVVDALKEAGIRAETDLRNEKISYKVREHSHQKVPVILVAREREAQQRTITVRRLGSNQQETIALDDAISTLVEEIQEKRIHTSN